MIPMPPTPPDPPDLPVPTQPPVLTNSLTGLPMGSIPVGVVVQLRCVLCGTRGMHRVGDISRWTAVQDNDVLYYACPAERPPLLANAKVRERFTARVTNAIQTWRAAAAAVAARAKEIHRGFN